jgi:predicted dinucleotide-binding enzyme
VRIAVIGAGNIGGTLGPKWAEAGHDVVYGVRHPEPPAGLPGQELPAEAVADADVVVLAVPGGAAKGVIAELGPALAGKVVIDATNDVSGAGKLHALDELDDGALPVRAFNTLGWESLSDPVVGGEQATLFYAAPEGRAKDVADQLIREVGLDPVWVGGVDEFETVDSLTRLWFTLAFRRGLGRRVALRLLRD